MPIHTGNESGARNVAAPLHARSDSGASDHGAHEQRRGGLFSNVAAFMRYSRQHLNFEPLESTPPSLAPWAPRPALNPSNAPISDIGSASSSTADETVRTIWSPARSPIRDSPPLTVSVAPAILLLLQRAFRRRPTSGKRRLE